MFFLSRLGLSALRPLSSETSKVGVADANKDITQSTRGPYNLALGGNTDKLTCRKYRCN